MTTTLDIRTATTAADRTAATNALSAAFADDPVFRWIYPDSERRLAAIPTAFALYVDAIARHGASLVTGDGAGAAMWVPPGAALVDDTEVEAFVGAVLAASPSAEDGERLETCLAILDEAHPHEDCWHLVFLGVVPWEQGTGVGSALLRNALARCDADGVPAYLEATSADNRRLYERHGFEVISELPLPEGPSLFGMWRDVEPVTR